MSSTTNTDAAQPDEAESRLHDLAKAVEESLCCFQDEHRSRVSLFTVAMGQKGEDVKRMYVGEAAYRPFASESTNWTAIQEDHVVVFLVPMENIWSDADEVRSLARSAGEWLLRESVYRQELEEAWLAGRIHLIPCSLEFEQREPGPVPPPPEPGSFMDVYERVKAGLLALPIDEQPQAWEASFGRTDEGKFRFTLYLRQPQTVCPCPELQEYIAFGAPLEAEFFINEFPLEIIRL